MKRHYKIPRRPPAKMTDFELAMALGDLGGAVIHCILNIQRYSKMKGDPMFEKWMERDEALQVKYKAAFDKYKAEDERRKIERRKPLTDEEWKVVEKACALCGKEVQSILSEYDYDDDEY